MRSLTLWSFRQILLERSDIIRTIRSENIRQAAYAAGIGEVRNAYEILVVILEEKIIVERPGRMWDITMHLQEIWCSGVG